MRPIAAINGVLLGTVVAIAIGSAVTLLVVGLLLGDHPRLEQEWRPLLKVTLLFALASAAFAVSMFAHLQQRRWRWLAQCVALISLVMLVLAFWPS